MEENLAIPTYRIHFSHFMTKRFPSQNVGNIILTTIDRWQAKKLIINIVTYYHTEQITEIYLKNYIDYQHLNHLFSSFKMYCLFLCF